MRRTARAEFGEYSGPKCPGCSVTLQVGGEWKTAAEVLAAHWRVVHPERPFDPGPPAIPPAGGPAQGQFWP